MPRVHPDRVPALHALEQRAALFDDVRSFFRARGYLEVETPILRPYASMEPYLVSFETTWSRPGGEDAQLFLHTSPEYSMKQVLAAHQRSIFQLARVFRGEESGATHLREFSLLEWYRVGEDYGYLMQETEDLVRTVCQRRGAFPVLRMGAAVVRVDIEFERLTVREAFRRYAGLDPFGHDEAHDLAEAARQAGCAVELDWAWEDVFHAVLLERVEPHLGVDRPTFLYDYPASLAALSKTHAEPDGSVVGERCELYAGGLELSNGFTELTDGVEQRRRFEQERALRARLGKRALELDEGLLMALENLPPCTGNALGLDRLLMLLLSEGAVANTAVTAGP